MPIFRPTTLKFLRDLKRNNRKPWFERHRDVYATEVLGPLRELVEEMDVRLAGFAPEIVGDLKRSIFRIYRDVRFSADKSPYKTFAACHFFHQDANRGSGKDADGAGAGFYFHFSPEEQFVGGGIWMPARNNLNKVREAIATEPEEFAALLAAPGFKRRYRKLDEEAMLRRMPRGYTDDHPAGRLLRFQSFTATRRLTEREFLGPRLPDLLERSFADLLPVVRWLNHAMGYRARAKR